MRPVMKNVKNLGEKDIVVQQFRNGNQGELVHRGVVRARVVTAEVQTLSFNMACSRRVTSVNVALAHIGGEHFVVGTESDGYRLTLSSTDVLPKNLACPCCGQEVSS